MSKYTQEQLQDWIYQMEEEEIDQILQQLHLTSDGSRSEKRTSLQQWMLGFCSNDLFEHEGLDEKTAMVKREELKKTLIDIWLRKSAYLKIFERNVDTNHSHPLLANNNQRIGENSFTIMGGVSSVGTKTDSSSDSDSSKQEESTIPTRDKTRQHHNRSSNHLGPTVNYVLPGGEILKLPAVCASLFAKLSDDLEYMRREAQHWKDKYILSEQLRMVSQMVPESNIRYTYCDQSGDHTAGCERVNIQTTNIDHHNDYSSSENEDQCRLNSSQSFSVTVQPSGVNNSSETVDRHSVSSSRGSETISDLSDSSPESSPDKIGKNKKEHSSLIKDIGKIVRGWKIHFDGSKQQCVESFLQSLQKRAVISKLKRDDILIALPECLKGAALTWYNENCTNCKSWKKFRAAALKSYGKPENLQKKLKSKASARTQRKGESVRDYIKNLMTSIIYKMDPQPPVEWQISLAYNNMIPELQKVIKRENIFTVDALLEMAMAAEATQNAESFNRPPSPSDTSSPKFRRDENSKRRTSPKAKVATREPRVAAVTANVWGEKMLKLMARQAELLKKALASTTDSPPSKKRWQRGSWRGRKKSRSPSPKSREVETPQADSEQVTKIPSKPPGITCHKCGGRGHWSYSCPTERRNSPLRQ